MKYNQAPEPPKHFDDHVLTPLGIHNTLIVDSEDEDSENDTQHPDDERGQYQPLSSINDFTQDETDEEIDDSNENVNINNDSSNNYDQSTESESIEEVINLYQNTQSQDIQIDEDQIRSIMANINLPTSSFPSWARSVPESQWSNLLNNQIERLNEK